MWLLVGLSLGGMVLLSAGIVILASERSDSAAGSAPVATAAPQDSASPITRPASSTIVTTRETTAPAVSSATTASPRTLPARPAPVQATPVVSRVEAYRGLGSWVDIYDDAAWKDPAGTVADMSKHGVKTLYIETGNSRSSGTLFKKSQLQTFITEAHAHGMKVVAWYLPDLNDLEKDFTRIDAAIHLTTANGQKFDSFSLDIESGAVTPQSARNRALLKLSEQIRDSAGASYPLGAIIPSPVGLSKKGSYWPDFPYTGLAAIYDAFVPMGYYTYHGDGAKLAYSDTIQNARILRSKKGCSTVPIHMIGGVSEESSAAEVEAFVRGSQESKCIGASLYGWAGTKTAHWQALKGVGMGSP